MFGTVERAIRTVRKDPKPPNFWVRIAPTRPPTPDSPKAACHDGSLGNALVTSAAPRIWTGIMEMRDAT